LPNKNLTFSPNSVQKSDKLIVKSAKPPQKLNWTKNSKKSNFIGLFSNTQNLKALTNSKNYIFGIKKPNWQH